MPTIKFDDYLEKRLKEPEFKTNFKNENAKVNYPHLAKPDGS